MRKLLSLLLLSSCLFISCSRCELDNSSQYTAIKSKGFYIRIQDDSRQFYIDNIFEDIEYYNGTLTFRSGDTEITLSNRDNEKLQLDYSGTWLFTTKDNYNKFRSLKEQEV